MRVMATAACPRCHGEWPVPETVMTAVLVCPRCGCRFPAPKGPEPSRVLHGEVIPASPEGFPETTGRMTWGQKALAVLTLGALLATGLFVACVGLVAFAAVALVALGKLALGRKPAFHWEMKVTRAGVPRIPNGSDVRLPPK